MKFTHVGRLVIKLEILHDMLADVQMHQAFASMMSPFIVIESRINMIDNTLEQVIFDPSEKILPIVNEGDMLPKLTISHGKTPLRSLHVNPCYALLQVPT